MSPNRVLFILAAEFDGGRILFSVALISPLFVFVLNVAKVFSGRHFFSSYVHKMLVKLL